MENLQSTIWLRVNKSEEVIWNINSFYWVPTVPALFSSILCMVSSTENKEQSGNIFTIIWLIDETAELQA